MKNENEEINEKEKKNKDNNKKNNNNQGSKKKFFSIISILLIIAIGFSGYTYYKKNHKESKEVTYTQLIQDIDANKIAKIEMVSGSTTVKLSYKEDIDEAMKTDSYANYVNEMIANIAASNEVAAGTTNEIKEETTNEIQEDNNPNAQYYSYFELKSEDKRTAQIPDTESFIKLVQDKKLEGKDFEFIQKKRNPLLSVGEVLISIFPMLMIFIMFILIFQMQGLGDKGKVYDPSVSSDKVTFDDVAGLNEEKAEMIEVVDFLKNPDKYSEMGAKVPKGVLLCGKPGTGKTLIAKAIAGEADVPFISMSGSEFVELFAGLGASRVRKLFEKAEKISPCIIFIDEIDAIGSRRENAVGGDSENNQTLNQLLVEMDGFGTDQSVIVIAATNRPEMLDEALLRPGRFDRRINIGLPDIGDREAILKLHADNKKIDEDVDLKAIAGDTAGFSGAELANILNEAAILATKRKHKAINNLDIEDAVKKVTVGLEKHNKVVSQKDKELTAYHEAGHAVVSKYLPTQDMVKEVSIVPRGVAGGYTMYKTIEDKFYVSKTEMEEKLISLMGGRAGEKVALNDISTGASNDLEVAMKIARDMITVYGMDDKIGPMSLDQTSDMYSQLQLLGPDMQDAIGKEVRIILEDAYTKAQNLLKEHRDKLDVVAKLLIEKEKINEEEFKSIFEDDK